jgi:Ala-tRNA(Pro) deacylase
MSVFPTRSYTAQGVAAPTNISGKELAKTVIVKIDDALAMALLPASLHVDLSRLRSAASANHVALASEGEFKERFPDCEPGAMPPFGNLYYMPVFADDSGQGNRVQRGVSSRTRETRLGRLREAS